MSNSAMEQNKIKTYKIEEPFAQAVINYLKTRPYVEVYKLIEGLLGLDPIETRETEKK